MARFFLHNGFADKFYEFLAISAASHNIASYVRWSKKDVDEWIHHYNEERLHSGRYCYGKTPMETFKESKHLAKESELDNRMWWTDNQDLSAATVRNNLTVRPSLD